MPLSSQESGELIQLGFQTTEEIIKEEYSQENISP